MLRGIIAKKNFKDLFRVGLVLKDAMDFIQDEFGVEDGILPGWQAVGQAMSIYLMCRCGNMYIMLHVRDSTIPDNLTDLGNFGNEIKTLMELRATIEQGLGPVLAAELTGLPMIMNFGGSFHRFLVRAAYNSKKSIAEVFAAKCILNWFDVPDVEFFIDGHGNRENHATSMSRRSNDATLTLIPIGQRSSLLLLHSGPLHGVVRTLVIDMVDQVSYPFWPPPDPLSA